MTTAPRTLSISSLGATLHAMHWPREAVPSFVLLHGGPGLPMDYEPIVQALAPRFAVLAFDQRGTARSPATDDRYTPAAYVDDLDAVVDALGGTPVHLFGHSWGGLLAQIYAHARPARVASLLLVSPSTGTGAQWRETEAEVMAWHRHHAPLVRFAEMGVWSLLSALGSDRATQRLFALVVEHYRRLREPGAAALPEEVASARARAANATRAALVAAPALPAVMHLDGPVTIVFGEHDIVSAGRVVTRARWPQARLEEIAGAGHLAWREQPEAFARVLHAHIGAIMEPLAAAAPARALRSDSGGVAPGQPRAH